MFEIRWQGAMSVRSVPYDDEEEALDVFASRCSDVRFGLCLWVELWRDGRFLEARVWDGRQASLRVPPSPAALRGAEAMVERAYSEA